MDQQALDLPSLPNPVQYFSMAVFRNNLYAAGGLHRDNNAQKIRDNRVYKLNLKLVRDVNGTLYVKEDLAWEKMPNLTYPRSSLNCHSIDDILYCFGGTLQDGSRTNQVEELHASMAITGFGRGDGKHWVKGIPMSKPRTMFSSTVFERRIYATGGKSGDYDVEKTVDVFYADENRWQLLPMEMTMARYYHSTFILNGALIVRGGSTNNQQLQAKTQQSLEILYLKKNIYYVSIKKI